MHLFENDPIHVLDGNHVVVVFTKSPLDVCRPRKISEGEVAVVQLNMLAIRYVVLLDEILRCTLLGALLKGVCALSGGRSAPPPATRQEAQPHWSVCRAAE